MSDYFKKILIPVDFSINTDVAVNKGLQLAHYGSTIHLRWPDRYISDVLPLGSMVQVWAV